jgi:hypothetical protein
MLEAVHDSDELPSTILKQHESDLSGQGQLWNLEAMAFNIPFTDTKTILGRIRSTNLHELCSRDAQFIVSVYVQPVVHRIFSVRTLITYFFNTFLFRCGYTTGLPDLDKLMPGYY